MTLRVVWKYYHVATQEELYCFGRIKQDYLVIIEDLRSVTIVAHLSFDIQDTEWKSIQVIIEDEELGKAITQISSFFCHFLW